MANFSGYQKNEGEKEYVVSLTAFVNAKSEKEATDFMLNHCKLEFGIGISVKELKEE